METESSYAVRLDVDYPEQLDRLTTLLRLFWGIPIAVIASLVSTTGSVVTIDEAGEMVERTGGIGGSLALAVALMIVVRQRYPRWWFDFARELLRFQGRVFAYFALLTDRYPSTVDEQGVHLELDYPDVERDLNRWLPLVKWLLAIPHYLILVVLWLGALLAIVLAWFTILLTGSYPRALFDYVVGVWRWLLRVVAYAFLLVTDDYPPFSLR
jgi:hypothetical protein